MSASRISRQAGLLVLALLAAVLVPVVTARTASAVSNDHFAWPLDGHTPAADVAWHQANESGTRAVDIQAAVGTGVGAAQSGVVVVASHGCANSGSGGCGHGFGNYVVIRHDRPGVSAPLYTLYGHLHSALTVNTGQGVTVGQQLGAIALSGSTTGGHTHFAISTCAATWWGSSCTVWNGSDTNNANVVKGTDIPGVYNQLIGVVSPPAYQGIQHLYAGTEAGTLYETYWGGGNTLTTALMASLSSPITSISTQITGSVQHIYSGTAVGTVYETYWGGGNTLTTAVIGNVGASVTSISTQITADGVQHVYTGTAAGTVYETYWGGGNALTTALMATLNSPVRSISSQVTGSVQHIYAGTAVGTVYETYWGGGNTLTTALMASLSSPITSISTQITGGIQHIFSGTEAGHLYETYWGGGNTLTTALMASIGVPVAALTTQYSADGVAHIYSGGQDGSVRETYWGAGHSLTTGQISILPSPITGISARIT